MEQRIFIIVNNCFNTNIYSYLETSGGQSYNPYLNVVHFFNASLNETSVAAQDSCFPALVSNTCCSIPKTFHNNFLIVTYYLETSGGQSYNPYLNVVNFFNTSLNQTSVAAQDSCFSALVSNMCCSIPKMFHNHFLVVSQQKILILDSFYLC